MHLPDTGPSSRHNAWETPRGGCAFTAKLLSIPVLGLPVCQPTNFNQDTRSESYGTPPRCHHLSRQLLEFCLGPFEVSLSVVKFLLKVRVRIHVINEMGWARS
jgi:hypothetical protein